MSKTVENFKNEGTVTIDAVNGSGEFAYTTYITSGGELKVTRDYIGIDDVLSLGGNSINVPDKQFSTFYTTVGGYKMGGNAQNSSCLTVSNAVYGICEQHQALSDYYGYRVNIFNHNSDKAFTVGLVKSAPSPTSGNNGTALVYNTLTFGGKTSGILSAATKVSDNDVDDIAPYILTSDIVYSSNVARTDISGSLPLQYVRTLFTSAISAEGTSSGTYLPAGINSFWRQDTGLDFTANGSSYDMVTGNSSFTPTSSYSYFITQIEFLYSKPTLKVLTLGDSTNTGVGTSAGYFAFIDSAAKYCRDNNDNVIVCPYKFASSGRRLIGAYNVFNQLVKYGNFSPNIVIIPSWSINDGTSLSAFDKSFALVSEMIETCKSKNIAAWVLTPACKSGFSEAEIGRWSDYRNKILGLKSYVNVFDIAKYQGDVTTGNWYPGYSTDGTHPNNLSTPIIGLGMYNEVIKKYV